MGGQREADRFYVVPTAVVYAEIAKRQSEHAERSVKDIGLSRMSFAPREDGKAVAGSDIEKKWASYLDRWELLDG
jgi:hypothetical protein